MIVNMPNNAKDLAFNNKDSNLESTDTEGAIKELATAVEAIDSTLLAMADTDTY